LKQIIGFCCNSTRCLLHGTVLFGHFADQVYSDPAPVYITGIVLTVERRSLSITVIISNFIEQALNNAFRQFVRSSVAFVGLPRPHRRFCCQDGVKRSGSIVHLSVRSSVTSGIANQK